LADDASVVACPKYIIHAYSEAYVLDDFVGELFVEIVLKRLDGALGKVLGSDPDQISDFCLDSVSLSATISR